MIKSEVAFHGTMPAIRVFAWGESPRVGGVAIQFSVGDTLTPQLEVNLHTRDLAGLAEDLRQCAAALDAHHVKEAPRG